jgi:thiol-disulfide isomerase/thioredoxin
MVSLLRNEITILKNSSVGGIISEISLPNPDKEPISLDPSRVSFTLVDFWASWCGPCRSEAVLLQDLYQKYKSSGFEIYGISLDTRENRWKDAVAKDNRIWINVSSLKGLRSKEAIHLGVSALPVNFLIDSEGKIIARDIHGAELVEILSELFEY